MTEQMKFITQELTKPPFNRSFNLISFDALEPLQLLQVLSDVICISEGQPVVNIRSEAADETALRLLSFLRIVKFKTPVHPDEVSLFRQQLVEGDKQVVYPLLTWILQRVPEIQKRSYLAKFLVRVDVPQEILSDPDLEQLYQECEELMEEFKTLHKQAEAAKTDNLTTEDIRQDIKTMEDEREQIRKRIDRLKKKVEATPNRERLLEVARQLRTEAELESQLQRQKSEQRTLTVHADQRCQRIQQQIKELKQAQKKTRPEDVMQKLEDEIKTNNYLLTEKLPKEIAARRKAVQELQKVASQPAMDAADLAQLQDKINEVNAEIARLVEQRHLKQDPTEDKLAIFRQQANMVERRKETTAESLHECRQELQQMEAELKEKRNQMRDAEGNEIITATAFKNYVNKLRTKSNTYKRTRQELQDLRAESGVLSRTDELLKQQECQMRRTLTAMGRNYDETDAATENFVVAAPVTANEAMSDADLNLALMQLTQQLQAKRSKLNPLTQEVKSLRERQQTIAEDFTAKKANYDSVAASLESTYARLEQEVKALRNEVNAAESQQFRLETEKGIVAALLERAEAEANSIRSGDRQKSFRDKLGALVSEAEETGRRLREEQQDTKEAHEDSAKQIKMWRDMIRILDVKKMCFLQANAAKVAVAASQNRGPMEAAIAIAGSRPRTAARTSISTAAGARPQTTGRRMF